MDWYDKAYKHLRAEKVRLTYEYNDVRRTRDRNIIYHDIRAIERDMSYLERWRELEDDVVQLAY